MRARDLAGLLMAGAVLTIGGPPAKAADQPSPAPRISGEPAYPTSPFHGVLDGDGRIIPCRCRFGGQDYRLGETVCMATAQGTVLTRCDLLLNNTSWIPTSTSCTLSDGPMLPQGPAMAIAGQR